MAKYNVEFSCGHSETVVLFGKTSERERKIAWYESQDSCSACYAENRDADRKAASDAAAAKAADMSLPTLKGSEKQIAWAQTIRVAKLHQFESELQRILPPSDILAKLSAAAQQEFSDAVALQKHDVYQQSSAKWWIDHRDDVRLLNRQRLIDCCPVAMAELKRFGGV